MLVDKKFNTLKKYLNFIIYDTDDAHERCAYCNILNVLDKLENINNEEKLTKLETDLYKRQKYN